MIKIENTDVYGWEAAIRGMRNPMNSWDKSDSAYYWTNGVEVGDYRIGENDLKLMKSLAKAGDDHGKFLRYINVTCDITSSLYWFKEFDTYKISTVANSCSTMHKIHAKEFAMDDFSHEHLFDDYDLDCDEKLLCIEKRAYTVKDFLSQLIIPTLNQYRNLYLETKDKSYWWQMIQLLPSSYNQKRTVQLNYQVLKNMYHARKNHKLDEWRDFCKWIESLPYSELIVGDVIE